MLQIIRRIAQDNSSLQKGDDEQSSIDHQFLKLWSKMLNTGWPDHATVAGIDRLYNIGGPTWLLSALVKVESCNFIICRKFTLKFNYCYLGDNETAICGKTTALLGRCFLGGALGPGGLFDRHGYQNPARSAKWLFGSCQVC